MGSIVYTTINNGKPVLKILGIIQILGDFDKVSISVNENLGPDTNYPTDIKIIAPSQNYNEAVSINQLFEVDSNHSQ